MTDAPVRTQVRTDDGWLDFQEYFVHRHQGPRSTRSASTGIEAARPTDAVLAALGEADVIVIGPSNPIVSLGPILAVPGMAEAIADARHAGVPVMAVSGIIGGKALKGPADRMLVSLGHEAIGDRASPRSSRRTPTRSCWTRWTRRSSRRSRRSAFGPTSPTRSWPTPRAGPPGGRPARARRRAGRPRDAHRLRVAAIVPVGLDRGRQDPPRRDARRRGAPRPRERAARADRRRPSPAVDGHRGRARRQPGPGRARDRVRVRGADAPPAVEGPQRRGPRGRDDVVAGGADAVLVVPIDLPFVTRGGDRCRRRRPDRWRRARPSLVVPDRHGSGTNVLGLRPPGRHRRLVRDRQSRGPSDAAAAPRAPRSSSSTGRSPWTSTRPTTWSSSSRSSPDGLHVG